MGRVFLIPNDLIHLFHKVILYLLKMIVERFCNLTLLKEEQRHLYPIFKFHRIKRQSRRHRFF